ncbi:9894_t:CDS:2 [Dentiscutata heterogama]|uniref:9894_t:CDS:1 n=1 Tax=Dentiscutata heterogama TaxID=1316150 RepID=A0ACA9KHF1_9GLOM|nr:9894_t:CDS:2 [Dentiscutata heterogama]
MQTTYQLVQKLHEISIIKAEELTELPKEQIKSGDQRFDNQIDKIYRKNRVTLKLLPNEQYDSLEVKRFKQQFRQFEHENILKFFGFTYVREYANNGNLRLYLQNRSKISPITWNEKLTLTRQIVNGLNFIHSKNIVHSELHPNNIFVNDSIPKITNIGISIIKTPSGLPYTPYSSPELIDKREISDKTKLNIYSLGVLLWEISSDGREPFQGNYDIKLAVRIINDQRPNCSKVLEELENISDKEELKAISDKEEYKENKTEEESHNNKDIRMNNPSGKDLFLDIETIEKTVKRKKHFKKHFRLTEGRNRGNYDLVYAEKNILASNEEVRTEKCDFVPTIYLAKTNVEPWRILNELSISPLPDNKNPFADADIIRIQIPVGSIVYHPVLNKEFIKEVRDALNISNIDEKRKKLMEIFDLYGRYVITKVILGGAITINSSEIANKSVEERLQAYLRWGTSYAKGEAQSIFEYAIFDDFPSIEFSPSKSIKSVKDLNAWLKDLYNCDNIAIISYEEYKQSYELLDKKLKDEILSFFPRISNNESLPRLIPQLPIRYSEISLSQWISKPSLLLYVRDWIEELSFRCGLFLRRSTTGFGRVAFRFSKEPKITPIHQIIVSLIHPQTQQMAYLLENDFNIKKADNLKFNEIPFIDCTSALNYPLEDFKYSEKQISNKIYCQIKYLAAEISFDLKIITPTESCLQETKSAVESFQPYENLSKVFGNNYGHIWPKTLIIGGTLSSTYDLGNHVDAIDIQEIIGENKFDSSQKIIEQHLGEWEKKFGIDTTLFLSNDGKAIGKDDIKDWVESLKNKPENWKIASIEDWIPTYKGLSKQLREEIELILDNMYHIVSSGESMLSRDDQAGMTIKFPGIDKSCLFISRRLSIIDDDGSFFIGPLTDDDYRIYGNIVKKNSENLESWEVISEASITFTHLNENGCNVIIHKNSDIRLKKDETMIIWFVIAKTKGYCRFGFRSCKVTCGTEDIYFTKKDVKKDVSIKTDAISTNYVFAISFLHEPMSDLTFYYDIKFKYWSKNTIALEIEKVKKDKDILVKKDQKDTPIDDLEHTSDDDLEESADDKKETTKNQQKQELQEKISFHWCIINTKEKILKNNNKEARPWNLYGNILDEDLRKEIESNYYGPSYSPMPLEEAIEQHEISNGNTLNAWKTFIKLWKDDCNVDVTYWIGYYIEENILNAPEKFYAEVLDGDSMEQAAMKFYKESADSVNQYNQYGQLHYARGLYHGIGVLEDKREAKGYFKQSAEQGNLDAMFYLGFLLRLDENPEGEEWIVRAAERGYKKSIKFCNEKDIKFKQS